MTGIVRRRLVITGVVQGVGFRPHVAALAASLGLAGCCRNDSTCVIAEVEGPAQAVADFARRVVSEAPPLASIQAVRVEPATVTGATGFVIGASADSPGARTMVPPDAATCAPCLAELRDPADRRYRHPFITCAHCGPRFTITLDLPYDRPATTMAGFPLCADCAREYADPGDRRHHAQPISCHSCGPVLRYARVDASAAPRADAVLDREDALGAARADLLAGRILAIKGVGGYHLVCDATNPAALARLRARKRRPHQPFAVMVATIEDAARIVSIPTGAAHVLSSTAAPIVLLPARAPAAPAPGHGDDPIAPGLDALVAPGLDEIGVMLPYSGLHHLLLEDMPPLVVTSGNRSGEPLAHRDADAFARLSGIADAFLTHDRPIAAPCDDSVVAWSDAGPTPIRRSRGYAPLGVALDADPRSSADVVLAAGSDLKSTVALVRDGQAFPSGHLGDLADLAARSAYEAAVRQLLRFHRSAPRLVVADLHPGYASRAWAEEFAASAGVPLRLVQHHHAHLASLAAEHGRLDDGLVGLVLDGTGYGCDGGIWGGELLRLGPGDATAERLGHLAALPLPGGDAGVRNPVRLALAALAAVGASIEATPLAAEASKAERDLYAEPGAWPQTTSAGRLFDVVAALLGVRGRITYEAQAAIELEHISRRGRPAEELPAAPISADGILDTTVWLPALARRVRAGEPASLLGYAFHAALAEGLARLALTSRAPTVGLSGGVFANRLLAMLLTRRLADAGVEVLAHRAVPAGDGGLSLGQAAIGRQLLRAGSASSPPAPIRPATREGDA